MSHGEHLRQAADSLERAPSATQRELRAHTLASTFRALGAAGGGPVAERVAEFAQAAREAVSGGIAVNLPAAFAVELRRAGEILSRSGAGDEAALAGDLAAVTAAVRALGGGAAAVVPIETLAPQHAPRTTPVVKDEPVPEAADFVGSWVTYQRLVAGGIGPASLDEFVRAPAPSLDTARPTTTAPRSPPPAPAAQPPVVDVRTLLYRGEQARRRATELRAAAQRVTGDQLRAIIDEVCDLVVLALEPEP